MKKFLGVFIAVVMLGAVTGCGDTKTLKCTMEESSDDSLKTSQVIEATFKKDTVTKITMTTQVKVSDEYASYLSLMKSSLESEFEEYQDQKGITVAIDAKDNTLSAKITADLDKMDEETKEELDMVDNTASYDEVKQSMEEEGYTCK